MLPNFLLGWRAEKTNRKGENYGKAISAQGQRHHGAHRASCRSDHLYDHGLHHRAQPEPADQLCRGYAAVERRVPRHLHRLRHRHDLHGISCQQALRHGARHGPQQLLRRRCCQHRRHQRVRVRNRLPGGARHHSGGGHRVPDPHALKGAREDRRGDPPRRALRHRPPPSVSC